MKLGLAILTYARRDAPAEVSCRLPEALRSLESTRFPGPVFIVDDGSQSPRHGRLLKSLARRYSVVKRSCNGGISRAKNSALRTLQTERVDIAFLAEDDVEFRPGWWQAYATAHERTGIHHFSWADDATPGMAKFLRHANGYPFVQTTLLNGVLLSTTSHALAAIGGFHVLPAKWGHEHTNWSLRMIAAGLAPFFCDIANSNRYLRLNRFSPASTVSETDKSKMAAENLPFTTPNHLGPIYASFQE